MLFGASCDVGTPGRFTQHASHANSPPEVPPTVTPYQNSDLLPPEEKKLKWRATISNIDYDWNLVDLIVRIKGGTKQAMFSQLAKNQYEAFQETGDIHECQVSDYFHPVAVMGSLISFDHENSVSCGTTYSTWRYTTLDVNKIGKLKYPVIPEPETGKYLRTSGTKIVSLNEIFSETDILTSLLANKNISDEISAALSKGKMIKRPTSLSEFDLYFTEYSGLFDGELYFEKDYLTRFGFHHVQDGNLAVWISLTPRYHVSQAIQEHLEIILPIPAKQRDSILLADSGEQGFLMKDAEKYVGTSHAQFDFESGKHK